MEYELNRDIEIKYYVYEGYCTYIDNNGALNTLTKISTNLKEVKEWLKRVKETWESDNKKYRKITEYEYGDIDEYYVDNTKTKTRIEIGGIRKTIIGTKKESIEV